MKSSAFSGLKLTDEGAPLASGVDQRLFGPAAIARTTPGTGTRGGPEHTETPIPANERTHVPTSERTHAPANTPTALATNGRTHGRANPHTVERTGVGESAESRRAPASDVGNGASTRRLSRYAHDLYIDQVRWMNRLKLELEEGYGVKVTGNAVVQLALDMLREDFVRNGEASVLIRALVHGTGWKTDVDDRGAAVGEEPDR